MKCFQGKNSKRTVDLKRQETEKQKVNEERRKSRIKKQVLRNVNLYFFHGWKPTYIRA